MELTIDLPAWAVVAVSGMLLIAAILGAVEAYYKFELWQAKRIAKELENE